MNVTVEEIKNIIEEADTMADMKNLQNDLPLSEQDIDSLDMANILLLLEEKFEVKIPDEDMDKVQSIDAIVSYLSGK